MGVDDGLVMRAYGGTGGGAGKAIMICGVLLFCAVPILNILNITAPSFIYGIAIALIIAGVVVSAMSGNDD
jgi:hypothetical protein